MKHALAWSALAIMLMVNVAQASDEAARMRNLKKRAEAGQAEAQYGLGLSYIRGYGVPMDLAEAAKWIRKAAEQRHDEARVRLADMYTQGDGVPKDPTEAVKWLRKAAEGGHQIAQHKLGGAFLDGNGVPKDLVEAYAWFSVAEEPFNMGLVERLMTKEQFAEASKLARERIEKLPKR